MQIPDGYETINQRAKRLGVWENTIRYQVRKGKLPHKKIKAEITVIPIEAQPL